MSVDKILEIAVSQVGYLEKKSNAELDSFSNNVGYNNYTKYWRDADLWWKWKINGNGTSQGNPWCACFVSWCFHKAEIESLITPFYYCPTGVNNFKKAGQWVTSNPTAGDIIFFKDTSGTACHVGIVEKVQGGKVYTIEGNTSLTVGVVANGGCVARKSYTTTYSGILGYGRPKYELKSEAKKMIETKEHAIQKLTEKGIINTPDYWLKACDVVKNLDTLLIKFANMV